MVAIVNLRGCPLDRPSRQASLVLAGPPAPPDRGNAYRATDEAFIHPVWYGDSLIVFETEGREAGWLHAGPVHGITVKARDLQLARLDSLAVAPREYTLDHLRMANEFVRRRVTDVAPALVIEHLDSLFNAGDHGYVSFSLLDAWLHWPRVAIFADTIRSTSAGADSTFDTADDISLSDVR
jgi:hypothetical protein